MEAFNRIAKQDLNTVEAEPDSLDALSAWTGENCPAKTIVRRKPAEPKAAQPKARAKAQPTYKPKPAYTKKPAYTAPKQAEKDIETETLHRLMRRAR